MRKVIGVGKDSLALILPKEWAVDQKIRRGSKVILFAQKNGQLLVQNFSSARTKVVIDAGEYQGPLLDAAILSSYILNTDEIVIQFPLPADASANMNYLADLSQAFIGMNLTASGPSQVTFRNLADMTKLQITDIFDQLLEILWFLLDQIERRDFGGNTGHQVCQMEIKYRLGVRLLIFVLRNLYLQFETGMSNIIQVLGYRIALQALRVLILQVSHLIPFLKGVDIPDLQVYFTPLRTLTQQAVRTLYASDVAAIKQINASRLELEALASKMEDATGILKAFFATFFDLLGTFREVAMTRCVEHLEITSNEEPIPS